MWRKFLNLIKRNINKSIRKDFKSLGIKLKNPETRKSPLIFRPVTREEKIARLKEIRAEEQELLESLKKDDGIEKPRINIQKEIIDKFKENINYNLWLSNMENFINYLQGDNAGKRFWESFKTIDNVWNLLLEKSKYDLSLENLNIELNNWEQYLIDIKYDEFVNKQAKILENNFFDYEKVKLAYQDILQNRYENAITRLINLGIIDDTEYNYEVFY